MLSVIPFGAVYPILSAASSGGFAVLALLCCLRGSRALTNEQRQFLVWLSVVSGILVTWILVQSVSLAGNPLVNAAWKAVDTLVPQSGGAISVNPAATREGAVTLLGPVLSAYVTVTLFAGDKQTLRLWRFLALFSACLILVTTLEYFIFPQTLLFVPRWAYQNDFTVTFVNRNTAATFVGVSLVLNLALLSFECRPVQMRAFWKATIASQLKLSHRDLWLVAHAAICFLIALSLALTRSRAGFISTALGTLMFSLILVSTRPPLWLAARGIVWGLTLGAIVLGTLLLFFMFGGLTIERMSEQGIEDTARWCTYLSTGRAITDNFWLGTGFGTFENVFPLYRDPACSGVIGLWDRAHNSYLEFVLGTGVIGLAVLLLVLGKLIKIFLRGLRDRRRFRFGPAAAIGALTITVLHASVDFSIQIQGFAVFVCSTLAAGVLFSTNDRVSQNILTID